MSVVSQENRQLSFSRRQVKEIQNWFSSQIVVSQKNNEYWYNSQ